MECFSSDALSPVDRRNAWNALYSAQVNHVDFVPADRREFSTQLSLGHLGPLQFAMMSSNRITIERTPRHISSTRQRRYTFIAQAVGSSRLSHCGNDAQLEQGDFVLCDSSAPHLFEMEDSSRILMLRMDDATIRQHLPTPEQFCGLRLSRNVGLTSTMFATIQKMQEQIESGFSTHYDDRLAHHLLEMLSMSFAIGFDERPDLSAVVSVRLSDVVRYIESNLRDPELSPAKIATGLNISPRYLRLIFSSKGERLYGYICRRRLEECAKNICDPRWSGHTLTEIAFKWGFNSAAHFARSFRGQFGVSPREYRQGQLN